jgi:positive regulator of sigma E activity
MEIEGKVEDIVNDFLIVSYESNIDCKHCPTKKACLFLQQEKCKIKIKNTANAKIGDKIVFELNQKKNIIIAFLIFFIPAFVLIISIYIMELLFKNNYLSVLISLIITTILFLILHRLDKNFFNRKEFQPHIIKVIQTKL